VREQTGNRHHIIDRESRRTRTLYDLRQDAISVDDKGMGIELSRSSEVIKLVAICVETRYNIAVRSLKGDDKKRTTGKVLASWWWRLGSRGGQDPSWHDGGVSCAV
jgi:hypothetical protein